MSEPMEFAKGLAGIPTGSSYNVAGLVSRESLGYGSRSSAEADQGVSGGSKSYEDLSSHESVFPGNRYAGKLSEMPDGSVAWTTPWAIKHDKEKGTYWLDRDYDVQNDQGGTVQIDLARMGGHYFISTEDITEFGEGFSENVEELLRQEGYLRLYTSESEVVKEAIANTVKKIDIKSVPERIKEIVHQLKRMK